MIFNIHKLLYCGLNEQLVHCHGCFDCLTIGHVRHLQAARELGDVLVVTVTPDRFVNKGPNRPVFDENKRAEMLDALKCVDYVAINQWPTAVEAIKRIRPAVYVKGGEYKDRMTPMLEAELAAVESVGGVLAFTSEIEFHSTDLLEILSCK